MAEKLKILLLNPPGRGLYLRDYFCSKTSKADYINAPIDLVMISGILNSGEFDLSLVDAVVEKLSPEICLQKIRQIRPDVIIALIGSVSLFEDILFLERLAEGFFGEILVVGDILLTEDKKFLEENKFITGAILNFISDGIYRYLKKEFDAVTDLTVRQGGRLISYPKSRNKEFKINLPIHEEFIKRKYRMPFVRHLPFATTTMSYGCPFSCSFCVMNTLPYAERDMENIFSELDYLKNLKVREILFLDQTLGIDRKRFICFLNGLIGKKYNFGWFGFSRVDLVDAELLALMKKAGCHTLWFGVESASDEILAKYRKGYTKQQIMKAFSAARKAGIKTLATFLIGLPEENRRGIKETIKFAKMLDPDYASFNFAVPRLGTNLRNQAVSQGLVSENEKIMDQSGQTIVMGTKTMEKSEVEKLRTQAILGFYLRPRYILKRLFSLRSFTEFMIQLRNFLAIIRINL